MQSIHTPSMTTARGRHPSRAQRRVLALATAALLSVAVGCGGDSTGPGAMGTASVTATGAVSASGIGLALFQSVSSGGTSLFQVVISPLPQSGPDTWQLQIANYSGRLAVGTHTLSPLSAGSTDPTATFYHANSGVLNLFNSTSGQLVITSSSAWEVRGTFTFTATDAAGGTATVTVNGSFSAQCAPGTTCQ